MRRSAGFRRVLIVGSALLLAACATQPPQPAAPPPPPPSAPPPAADSMLQRHQPADPVTHLTPEQIAAERKALPRVLGYLGEAMKKNPGAVISSAKADGGSYAARSIVNMMATVATDPTDQAAFVNRLSDHDIEVLATVHDQRAFGEQIGLHLVLGAMRGMPEDRLPSALHVYGDLYGVVRTPAECQQLMSGSGSSLSYLPLLDRLPPAEVDELMADYLAGARVLDPAPPRPLSAMENEVIKLAVQHYFAELPPDQVERYRKSYKNPDSADRCWGVQLVTKALMAGDAETQKLGGRMFLAAIFAP